MKYPELSGKRLLILGGSLWKDAIKSFAEENDIILIATGNNKNAGIFEIADEAYSVNSTDSEAMKRLIIDAKIDGVYMGGSEPVITAASSYLNELGLPCYCTHDQWEYLEDKGKFKELCIINGLPVAKKFQFDEVEEKDFPVITKPTDGCGSNGFSVCHNKSELEIGYSRAKQASPTGSVLIEKFLKNNSVVVFYTLSNGEAFFSGLEDKYPVRYAEQGSYVAGMHLFESDLAKQFMNQFEASLKKLFRSIGLKEGPVWIEVFYDNGQFYFNEVGYRYSGSVSIYPVDYFYGINQVAADIYYALTGKSVIKGFTPLCGNSKQEKKYAIYSVHVKPGTIKRVDGIDDLLSLENVVVIPTTKNIGDTITSSGTVGQVFAFVHFTYTKDTELRSMIERIQHTLKVLDVNGRNIVNPMIDPKSIVIR